MQLIEKGNIRKYVIIKRERGLDGRPIECSIKRRPVLVDACGNRITKYHIPGTCPYSDKCAAEGRCACGDRSNTSPEKCAFYHA